MPTYGVTDISTTFDWTTAPRQPRVSFALTNEYQERWSSDGAQEVVWEVLVRWDQWDAFREAVLPWVQVGPWQGESFALLPYRNQAPAVQRRTLQRQAPLRHPTLPHLYATRVELLEPLGIPLKQTAPAGEVAVYGQWTPAAFVTRGPNQDSAKATVDISKAFLPGTGTGHDVGFGLARGRVHFQPLPYLVDASDAECNQVANSELLRYVTRRAKPAAQNIPLRMEDVDKPFAWFHAPASGTPGVLGPDYMPWIPQTAGTGPPRTWMAAEYQQIWRVLQQRQGNIQGVRYGWDYLTTWFQTIREGQRHLTLTTVHLTYTWHMVPRVPRQALHWMGMVNAEVFDPHRPADFFGERQFRPGTILYLYCEVSPHYYDVKGTPVVDITYHFLYRDNWLRSGKHLPDPFGGNGTLPSGADHVGFGHNFFYHPSRRRFQRVVSVRDITPGLFALPRWGNPQAQVQLSASQITADLPADEAPLPPNVGANQVAVRWGNVYPYVDLNKLFVLDGPRL
jgi:hypothetical protein